MGEKMKIVLLTLEQCFIPHKAPSLGGRDGKCRLRLCYLQSDVSLCSPYLE